MILSLRHTLAFALIAGAAFLIAQAPALHAHEDKTPAHEKGAMSPAKPMAHEGHDGAHGDPTVRITFMPAKTLQAGASVPVVVKLATKDGKPVTSADLELAHTKLVHLLIVDASLTSYSHEHPVETAPGEWSFTFTPKQGGTYTVFADL